MAAERAGDDRQHDQGGDQPAPEGQREGLDGGDRSAPDDQVRGEQDRHQDQDDGGPGRAGARRIGGQGRKTAFEAAGG